MDKVSTGLWKTTVDGSKFDFLLFARVAATSMEDWNAKTMDLPVCAFSKKRNLYTISSTSASWVSEGKTVKGSFSHYGA
jgi:hypothetical protein